MTVTGSTNSTYCHAIQQVYIELHHNLVHHRTMTSEAVYLEKTNTLHDILLHCIFEYDVNDKLALQAKLQAIHYRQLADNTIDAQQKQLYLTQANDAEQQYLQHQQVMRDRYEVICKLQPRYRSHYNGMDDAMRLEHKQHCAATQASIDALYKHNHIEHKKPSIESADFGPTKLRTSQMKLIEQLTGQEYQPVQLNTTLKTSY